MKQTILKHASAHVPRYTSYPPATAFSTAVGQAEYCVWLGELPQEEPVSLYIHVPYCREVCWYCACNMKLVRREQPLLDYADALLQELELLVAKLPSRMRVSAIHWGGGTPTSLTDETLEAITARIGHLFTIAPDAEVSFEIDPRTFDPDRAVMLRQFGATRVSLGVQEFDAAVQAAVNRIQPFEQVRAVVDALRTAGIQGINFDLMYGLPHQTESTLAKTIDQTVRLQPSRIALFGYAHVPWMAKRQTQIDADTLPSLEQRFDQAGTAASALVDAGYRRIGLDHFALPQDALTAALDDGSIRRTFQGYSAGGSRTILGLGSSSISTLPQGYAQNVAETGAWSREMQSGRLPVHRGYALTADDRLRSDVIQTLMCHLAVDIGDITKRHGFAASALDEEIRRCAAYTESGLAVLEGRRLTVPEQARPALRLLAAVFDAHFLSVEKRHAVAV